MIVTFDNFVSICKSSFAFLTREYACRLHDKKKDTWGYRLRFMNGTTGVIITFETREFFVFLQICRLVSGEFDTRRGEIRPDSRINNFDFDDVLLRRSPVSIVPPHQPTTPFTLSLVKGIVRQHASNLRQFGRDILRGDFSEFPTLDETVKERARTAAVQKWGDRAREFGW